MNANVHERVLTASDTLRDCRRVVRVVFLLLSLSSVAINLSDLQAQEFPSSAFQSPILQSPDNMHWEGSHLNPYDLHFGNPPLAGHQFPPSAVSPLAFTDWNWSFLPQGFLYQTYWASTAEPRLSTRLINDSGNDNWLDSQIGGRLGIVRFGNSHAAEGFQIDLLGGVNLRQNLDTEDWEMTGTDYRFDIPLTYRRGAHAWKLGYYHVSAHMGDEFLVQNPSVSRIDYYRNAIALGYSYNATPELRLYGEIDYGFSLDFAEPWHLQFGFDWGPSAATGIRGAPFLAANVHLREELDFGGNLSMQAGWAWKGVGSTAGILRTGLHYYNGGSPQFSFYRESEQQIGWGLWYDY